jgi:hypothetical protein
MKNVKNWAVFSACVAVAFAGFARAETPIGGSSTMSLDRPVMADDAAPAPAADRPLMAGLDYLGLAKPLKDANITIGGYVEGGYTLYSDRSTAYQTGRVFDSRDQDLVLDQVDLFVNRSVNVTSDKFDIGGRIEWVYGADARFIHSTGLFDYWSPTSGPKNQFDLVQAYVDLALPVGNGIQVRLGKFVTPTGAETIDPTSSPLYSRGLLFDYLQPFTLTGVDVTYVLNDKWTFNAGIVRGWDEALKDTNGAVSGLGGATYTIDKTQSIATTLIVGPNYPGDSTSFRTLVDVVYTWNFADNLTFKGNGDFIWETDKDGNGPSTDDGFAGGIGGWVTWRPSSSKYVAVNGRAEYLYDGNGMRVVPGTANNYYELTAGLDITPFADNAIGSNFHVRPEVRFDYAESAVFGATQDKNSQFTFAVDAYFAF